MTVYQVSPSRNHTGVQVETRVFATHQDAAEYVRSVCERAKSGRAFFNKNEGIVANPGGTFELTLHLVIRAYEVEREAGGGR